MTDTPTILVIGTFDTKDAELTYLSERIVAAGGRVHTMDVSVLGDPGQPTDVSKHDVTRAAGSSIKAAIASADENVAMQIMARGAAALARGLQADGAIDGVIVLGGTMGTDLALDVCNALPLGVPKYVVSTVAFSPLLPAQRLAPDIQMILWAGGLYGLNSICKSSLSQAAGAVVGAARTVETPGGARPLIGMTSLGKTALTYMVALKPALEARGFEVAIFHATGMGGRAFEGLAAQGRFACVFDFCTQEVGNHLFGSSVSAGSDRMTNAAQAGTPQIVAPGCYDLVDVIGWQPLGPEWKDNESHAHNRLLSSILLNTNQRRAVAREHGTKLSAAQSPSALILPSGGMGEWDRPGGPLHDGEGLAAFCEEMRQVCPAHIQLHDIPDHINDDAFAARALQIFDTWRAEGIVQG